MAASDITAARIRELLHYDPETGIFVRKIKTGRRGTVGDVVNRTNPKGYARVQLDGVRGYAHRFAWLYVHGEHPKCEIDHINGDKSDNRIANLRDVEIGANRQNVKRPRKNNTSGHLGVVWNRDLSKWCAHISVNSKTKHLGVFDDAEEAARAYLVAKRTLHQGNTL